MNSFGDGPHADPTPEELQVIARLRATTPEPSDALRRHVHTVIRRGVEERALRRRAVLAGMTGTAMIALAAAAAVTWPG